MSILSKKRRAWRPFYLSFIFAHSIVDSGALLRFNLEYMLINSRYYSRLSVNSGFSVTTHRMNSSKQAVGNMKLLQTYSLTAHSSWPLADFLIKLSIGHRLAAL